MDYRSVAVFSDSPTLSSAVRNPRLYVLTLLTILGQSAVAQSTSRVSISRAPTNVIVSWTGRGTLQQGRSLQDVWHDVLEAPNPLNLQPTNANQFFRLISRWSTRSNLAEANSEMSVAELNGNIYVIGGYPASRVTVRTVQVYDSLQNRWHLTTPLPIPLRLSTIRCGLTGTKTPPVAEK